MKDLVQSWSALGPGGCISWGHCESICVVKWQVPAWFKSSERQGSANWARSPTHMADHLDVFISLKSVHTSIGKAWMMVLRNGLDMPTHMSIVWSKNTSAVYINHNNWIWQPQVPKTGIAIVLLYMISTSILLRLQTLCSKKGNKIESKMTIRTATEIILKTLAMKLSRALKFRLVSLTPEDIESCPYTPVFAQRMLDWFQKLEWPDESMAGHDSRPCSLLELYADFVLSTQTLAPAQRIPKAKCRPGFKSCYCLRDLCFEACLVEKSFASIFDGLLHIAQLGNFTNLQSHDTCKCRFHASACRCAIATQNCHWWSNLYIAAQSFYNWWFS